MSLFPLYFELGFRHIANFSAYDHMLFLLALVAGLTPRKWKETLGLITAFTLGHTLTLALATLRVVVLPTDWIEFFIPVTILITALFQVIKPETQILSKWPYVITLCFGFIHGLGFSNFLIAALGQESDLVLPLFGFNVGLEAGQVLIVACLLAINSLLVTGLKVPLRIWTLLLSGFAGLVSVYLAVNSWPL